MQVQLCSQKQNPPRNWARKSTGNVLIFQQMEHIMKLINNTDDIDYIHKMINNTNDANETLGTATLS